MGNETKDLETKEHLQQIPEMTGWDEVKASFLLKIPLARDRRKIRENAIKKPHAKKSSNH